MTQENITKEIVKILVVDDVDANRFVLRDIIQEMGHQPVLAENGMQALKIMERIRPQLMILDIAMPGMDGYEFCKLMKDDPVTRNIPIIFISAFDDPADVVRGFDCGGEDYITKPFIPKVVQARLRLHLKLYDTTNEMMEMNRRLQTSVNEQLHTYVDTIELASPLCDLGNVAIPTELLQKRESLSAEELEVIRKHAAVGARILQDIKDTGDYNDFLQMSIDIAHYHHENWDGSGYPCGKAGDEIPLSAQIVSIVGAYCAMTENRAYRDSYHIEKTLSMLEEDAGTKFNPDIFQILRKIHRQLH